MRFPSAPAVFRGRAFLLALGFLGLVCALQAQSKRYRPAADFAQGGLPDQSEGHRILGEFRSMGIPGDYFLEFQLQLLPRHGERRVSLGALWGSHNDQGSITRICLKDPEGGETRFLIQNGPQPSLWHWKPGQAGPVKLGAQELFTPMAGTLLTPFDLQMPYVYWRDAVYEGLTKALGRPAHRFLFFPPPEIQTARAELYGVRIAIDSQYKALVESQQIGTGNKALRTLSLLELKKSRDQWLPRSLDLRDEQSRDKTRFLVTAAATAQSFSRVVFEPSMLGEAVEPPQAPELDRF